MLSTNVLASVVSLGLVAAGGVCSLSYGHSLSMPTVSSVHGSVVRHAHSSAVYVPMPFLTNRSNKTLIVTDIELRGLPDGLAAWEGRGPQVGQRIRPGESLWGNLIEYAFLDNEVYVTAVTLDHGDTPKREGDEGYGKAVTYGGANFFFGPSFKCFGEKATGSLSCASPDGNGDYKWQNNVAVTNKD